jgi:hypothetical protein
MGYATDLGHNPSGPPVSALISIRRIGMWSFRMMPANANPTSMPVTLAHRFA